MPERVDLRAIAPQPWKNGAGVTREIAFGGASAVDFDWRVSLAEVACDAPFSPFAGVDRRIALWQGAGMHLRARDGSIDHALTTPLAPFAFSGDLALEATLIDGPSADLNVMTRRGVFRSALHCERGTSEIPGGDVTLLLCRAGRWRVTAGAASTLDPMQVLLWRAPLASLRLEPLSGAEPALLTVRLCHDRPR